MASIEKRPNGAWRVRWTDRSGRPSETFDTEAEALDFKRLVEAHRGWPPGWTPGVGYDEAQGRTSVREAFESFLAARQVSAGAHTLGRYRSVGDRLVLPRWGRLPIDAIRLEDVQALVADLHAAGKSAKTIRNVHGVLYGLFQHARRSGWRTDNPCELTTLPAARKAREIDYLTPEQFAGLLEAARPDVRDLLLVAVGTGLRWGEVTALSPASVVRDHTGVRLRVFQAWKQEPGHDGVATWVLGRPKTQRSFREVYVTGRVADLVEKLAADGGDWLFTAPSGGPWRYPNFHENRWAPAVRAAREAGVALPEPCRFHFLRHSYAWWSLSAGADLASLQDQMGHESIQMTKDRYGGLNPLARAASAAYSAAIVDGLAPRGQLTQ